MRWGFDYNPSNYNTTNYKIPNDGIIELIFDPPANLAPGSVLGIEAEYKGNVQWFSSIPSAVARSGNFMLARLRTEIPTVIFNFVLNQNMTNIFNYRVVPVNVQMNLFNYNREYVFIANKGSFIFSKLNSFS